MKQVVGMICEQSVGGAWLLLDPAGSFDARVFRAVLSAHPDQISDEAQDELLQAGYRLIRDLDPWDQACVRKDYQREAGFLSAVKNDPVAAWRDLQETEPTFSGTVRPSWLIQRTSTGFAAVGYAIGTGPLGMEERVVVLRAMGSNWAVVLEEVLTQS